MKTISFIYFTNRKDSLGVELKIRNLSKSFEEQGFKTNLFPIDTSKGLISSTLKLFSSIHVNSKYFFIRYNNSRNIFLCFLIFLLKMKEKKIILEIPTPIKNHIKEIIISSSSKIKKIYALLTTYILGPFPFFFPNLVIQYAEEGVYFKFLTKKTLLLGNGIDVDSYGIDDSLSNRFRQFNTYKMVVIANLAPWHGIDLLIEALKIVPFNFNLKIIGDGPEKKKLEELVSYSNLKDKVRFHGKLPRFKYLPFLQKAHLGIGSLNWDIVNIKTSSALKLREYVSSGLPIIFSSFDPDLSGKDNCIQVDCNVGSVLEGLIKSHENASKFSPKEQYDLAKKELDMSIKVNSIISNLK